MGGRGAIVGWRKVIMIPRQSRGFFFDGHSPILLATCHVTLVRSGTCIRLYSLDILSRFHSNASLHTFPSDSRQNIFLHLPFQFYFAIILFAFIRMSSFCCSILQLPDRISLLQQKEFFHLQHRQKASFEPLA